MDGWILQICVHVSHVPLLYKLLTRILEDPWWHITWKLADLLLWLDDIAGVFCNDLPGFVRKEGSIINVYRSQIVASLPINSFIEVDKPGSALLDLIECKIQLLPQRRHHSRDLMTRLCGTKCALKTMQTGQENQKTPWTIFIVKEKWHYELVSPFVLVATYSFKIVVRPFPKSDCVVGTKDASYTRCVRHLFTVNSRCKYSTYKHASRDGSISGCVVSILFQIRALMDESLACSSQPLLLEVTLREGRLKQRTFRQITVIFLTSQNHPVGLWWAIINLTAIGVGPATCLH